ncbi:MAG TPA: hypothetical protein VII29_07845, partial [Terriglobales bacterium]
QVVRRVSYRGELSQKTGRMPLEPDILQPFARLAWILDRQHGPANRAIPNIEKMSFDVAHVRIG